MKKLKLLTLTILLLSGIVCLCAINELPLIAEFQGEHIKSSFGHKLVCLDFNHDGYDDLIVHSRAYGYSSYPNTSLRGKVYIYYGGPGFSSNTEPAMTLEGDYPNGMQRVVGTIHNIGDVNGDGYDDLAIFDYVPRADDSLRLLIFYGGTPDISSPNIILVKEPGERWQNVFRLGDIDGDGYDDIGFSCYIDGVNNFLDIVWGGSFERQNVVTLPRIGYRDCSIVGLGDINNDGYHDFSIGYYDADGYSYIRVYYGNQDRVYEEYSLILNCYAIWDVTRRCVPLGDLNNDGFDDFMGWLPRSGDITVWLGSSSAPTMEPSLILSAFGGEYAMSPRPDDSAGITYGDLNGDGYDDVIAIGFLRFGVWLGSSNMNGFVDLTVRNSNLRGFPFIVSGDFNGDGFADVAVSAPDSRYDNYYPGYVYVYAGNAELKDTTVTNDDPAIPSISDNLAVELSPNPITRADNTLNIELQSKTPSGSAQVAIEIYNIKGQSVLKEVYPAQVGARTYQLPTSSLANGIYLCRVAYGKQQTTGKICVIK